jgi:protocatechuate 3,4-dioxygenase alpha subunit
MLKESPSQTAGPYVHIGCTPCVTGITSVFPQDNGAQLITGAVKGDRITISGVVYDGAGDPLRDAMVEIWQADAAGLYHSPSETRGTPDPHFTGWGRAAADLDTGRFAFDTIRPGAVDGAPFVTLWIVARGINLGLHTRGYFPDCPENAGDPLLRAAGPRADTLILTKTGDAAYHLDIHLQGPLETVFLNI